MQNVLEIVVLGESAARKITHSLTYLLTSQSDGKCANSAIFQMTIIKYETYMHRKGRKGLIRPFPAEI